MNNPTAIILVIVGALLLICGTTLAVMLYNLEFFTVRLTSWYDVVLPLLVAVAGLVLVIVGVRALRRARRDRAVD